jgi:hypothetical protein
MDEVAGSGNDEFYTPAYAITPILKYVPSGSAVWCPFDTEDSLFVKMLRTAGHRVTATHIGAGEDFFKHEPPAHYDYIISNPPYSLKSEVFERLFTLKAKFAMLVGVVGLFESQRRFSMFRDNAFEIMFLNKRVAYFKSFEEQRPSVSPPFSSVYLTSGMLPHPMVFETIEKSR